MSLVKLLMIFVAIGIVIGLIAAYTGVINMDKDGNISLNKEELDKQTTTTEMSKANLLMAQTKYEEAISLYHSYIEKNPKAADVPEAAFRIGKCHEDAKQEPQAIKAYKEYLAAYPSDSIDRRNRAQSRISFLENAGYKAAK